LDSLGEFTRVLNRADRGSLGRIMEGMKEYMESYKKNPELYETIENFFMKYAKNGPELYEYLHNWNLEPDKQWEINLQKQENAILYNQKNQDDIKKDLITKLAQAQVPISIQSISELGNATEDIVKDIKEMMFQAAEELIDEGVSIEKSIEVLEHALTDAKIIGFTIKQNENNAYEFHGKEMLNGFVTTEIKPEDFDVKRLSNLAINSINNFIKSGEIADTMSLTKNQVEIALDSALRISQKYGSVNYEKEVTPSNKGNLLNEFIKSRGGELNVNEFTESKSVLEEIAQPVGPYIETPIGPIIENPIGARIGDDFNLDEIGLPNIEPQHENDIVCRDDNEPTI
jgi:hypothetical protein